MVLGAARFIEATPFSRGVRHADTVDTVQQPRVVEGLQVSLYAQVIAGAECCSLVVIEKFLDCAERG
jgi:hypothetical protein